jgi:hypothetical protein
MKTCQSAIFAILVGWCVLSNPVSAQTVTVPGDVLEKLQQQPPAEVRKMTVVPGPQSSPVSERPSVSAADIDKMRSLQNLLEQVETNSGAQAGTLKAIAGKGTTVSLQHDLGKVRQNYSPITDAPFGAALSELALSPEKAVANTSATVEYNTKYVADTVEQVVSIKSKDTVAANAFTSGERPVSLKVVNANLIASQIPSAEGQLAVNVQVGAETRKLNVGDVSRFGNFNVTILASANRSSKVTYEGLPYVLRLQVMPVR